MRHLFCMSMMLVAVSASIPDDSSITADLACETARMAVQSRQQITPTPPANDACENCHGTGKLGDGRVVVDCPACAGTGKKPKSVCVNCPQK
jgi:DnaJ-class molecular chaperone